MLNTSTHSKTSVGAGLFCGKGIFDAPQSNCSDIRYKVTPQNDMLQSVYNVLNSPVFNHNVRLLLYNGDVDFVCNFLGDNWFAHRLLEKLNETVPCFRCSLPIEIFQLQSYVASNVTQMHEHSSWLYKGKDAGSWESYTLVDVMTVSVNFTHHIL